MAVSVLEKITLLAPRNRSNALLQTIQSLGNVELVDVTSRAHEWEKLKKFFPNERERSLELSEQLNQVNDFLQEIKQAIFFIEGNSKKKKGEKIQTAPKRETVSFSNFIHKKDSLRTKEILEKAKELEKALEESVKERGVLNQEEILLSKLKGLDISAKRLQSKELVHSLVKVNSQNVGNFVIAVRKKEIYLEEIFTGKDESIFYLLYRGCSSQEMQKIFSTFGIHFQDYPYQGKPKDELKNILVKQENLLQKIKAIKKEIHQLRFSLKELKIAEEICASQLALEQVKETEMTTNYLVMFSGFVAQKEKKRLLQRIEEVFHQEIYVSFEEIDSKMPEEDIPTLLENHSLVTPFELLTEMYALPKYREIDPTPWMTPFYLLFFGMMVADVGYGALMLIATTVLLKVKTFSRSVEKFLKFFRMVSITTVLFGVIYSSFFGASLPTPAILSTTTDVNTILVLSLIFGFLQIMTGLLLGGVSLLKKKEYIQAANQSFAWIGILLGLLFVVLGKMILASSLFTSLGMVLAISGAIVVVVAPVLGGKNKIAALASGLFDLYGATSYIGDLVSYTRLMALGISGGSIAAAFNLLIDFMPSAMKFTIGIVLLILLHALNMFLSFLGGYVHAARLQYVEFFGKFYNGGGKAFKPLKPTEKYMNFKN